MQLPCKTCLLHGRRLLRNIYTVRFPFTIFLRTPIETGTTTFLKVRCTRGFPSSIRGFPPHFQGGCRFFVWKYRGSCGATSEYKRASRAGRLPVLAATACSRCTVCTTACFRTHGSSLETWENFPHRCLRYDCTTAPMFV